MNGTLTLLLTGGPELGVTNASFKTQLWLVRLRLSHPRHPSPSSPTKRLWEPAAEIKRRWRPGVLVPRKAVGRRGHLGARARAHASGSASGPLPNPHLLSTGFRRNRIRKNRNLARFGLAALYSKGLGRKPSRAVSPLLANVGGRGYRCSFSSSAGVRCTERETPSPLPDSGNLKRRNEFQTGPQILASGPALLLTRLTTPICSSKTVAGKGRRTRRAVSPWMRAAGGFRGKCPCSPPASGGAGSRPLARVPVNPQQPARRRRRSRRPWGARGFLESYFSLEPAIGRGVL